MKHKGFTVVELIVIIVAIAILASITMVSYSYMREDAADTKIRSAVKSVGDAISMYEARTASLAFTGPEAQLSDLDTVLVPNYLSPGYRDGLSSKNAEGTGYNGWSGVVMYVYRCTAAGSAPGSFVVYASLNAQTTEDYNAYDTARSKCGPTLSAHTGIMHASNFKYAQFF